MLYPSGLEFITAFLGCLYAGIIAVPAYPPRKNQKNDRLKSIIEDSKASIILSTKKSRTFENSLFKTDETFNQLLYLETDSINIEKANVINVSNIKADDIAFLQYTSGSTGKPKGVVVSHANIMNNMEIIYKSQGLSTLGLSNNRVGVSWLPHFHDMGLMAGVLQPLYGCFEMIFMPSNYFLQKPIRWLETISKYKATYSGGPNFAYDLCASSIKDKELENIDLSSWKVAFNGAEPIHATILNKFSKKFEKCGFKHTSHHPCYGMAETTLMVTGGLHHKEPTVLNLDSNALKDGRIIKIENSKKSKQLVSNGKICLNHEIIVVDSKTHNIINTNEVGEVWIKGESVAQGYWQKEEQTEEIFNAYTNDTKEGPFLRTGDLGFFYEDELYICGRAKDLLIIRGRNYYPQDIEAIASSSHEDLIYN